MPTEPPPHPPADRYHAIDALRALAMLLGVVLHAALSFMVTAGPFTPRQDTSQWFGFDMAVAVIHSFRMQLFFVVAGVFTALIMGRRTPREFIVGRVKRVGLPLVGASIFILPLTIAPFVLAQAYTLLPRGWQYIYWSTPGQFWFLAYLMEYSAVAWLLALVGRATGLTLRPMLHALGAAAAGRAGFAVLVVPTIALTLPMASWTVETPHQWIQGLPTLAYYAFFFLVGYAVQSSGAVMALGRQWKWVLPMTVLVLLPCMLAYLIAGGDNYTPTEASERAVDTRVFASGAVGNSSRLARTLIGSAIHSMATWGAIISLFGLFERYCRHMRGWVRWLADSSYWVYLVHLPPVYFMALWLAERNVLGMDPGPMQALVKFGFILAAASVFSLGSYALIVRRTWLETVVGGGNRRVQ